MPSLLTDSLYQRLIDAFPPDRAYAPAVFEREPMPAPVAHFLTYLLRRRLYYEAENLAWPRSSWFDHDGGAVQRAHRALVEALSRNGHYPAEAWEQALHQAVEQVTAYLVRPIATLVAFVFQDAPAAVQAAVVERRLGYFTGYAYLHETVRLYFQQKHVEEIDRTRFAELLRLIDRQVTQDYDADAWLRLLKPLFDLSRGAFPDAGTGVPAALLLAFFKEKEAEAVLQRLQAVQEREGVNRLDEAGLRLVLTPPQDTPAVPEHDDVIPPPAAEPLPAGSLQGPVPLWKQFQQGFSQAPAPQRQTRRSFPRTPDEPRRQPAAASGTEVPRWMQFRPEAAAATPAPALPVPPNGGDLERAVLGDAGIRNRDLFIKHLFAGSSEEYRRVLRYLETAPGWAEASQIIAEEVFRKNQVNIYSDPAVLFTDAVEARFANGR